MRSFILALAAASVQASRYANDFKSGKLENIMKSTTSNGIAIEVTVDGEKQTKYVASDKCTADGSTYRCPEDGRGYIMNSETLDTTAPDYWTVNLAGATVEYDVDLSGHGCGCFNTFYTVSMPAKNEGGAFDISDGYFYCDAGMGFPAHCPEFDIMEANQYAFATTPHKCDAPNGNGHYYNCDGSGAAANSVDNGLSYGPGGGHQIDTTQPFHVKLEIHASNGSVSGATTTMSQNGRTQSMSNWNGGYLGQMSSALTE